ncbi:Arc family DNA-binding protein [Roseinatronobacter bogoriensis]|uniref:Arc family DNA-binding protein n=1 Tax=Roseinatronobacter bogoriensis subsp. barguzinensis TaxID=441209 RepID=A0A2K8KCL6_9RHOB|nr:MULTISPECIES: Arc family DNA-binding protein [Rhodobaca]ATX66706.1 Arc family DNA-binding protein [Rhodobaca barguzinensis]MBB4207891.1 putative HicB family RNase H-like nuclease [Rhodobaca bogoriensis DSM 18756]TDW32497.1 Arc-like DNA binding dprotein [Rhodobaca barguzinensis]TDY71043.1 Arc-like DNA binding dprotein [Rhodobaca bogoriensis DSM 18756]
MPKKPASDYRVKIMTRLPLELRNFLRDQAASNGSSMNSELIRAVRERMEKITAQPTQP